MYLATVIDCCSRRVAGWAIAEHMRTELIEDALKAADSLRGGLTGSIFHLDHGSQGGFNRSSQHRVVNLSVVGLQALPPVFSTRVFGAAGC
jgi:transposase InsO family protein